MKFDPGKLTSKITIQQKAARTNGEPNDTWTTFKTVWAEINPTTGSERFFCQQIIAEGKIPIKIRYCAGLTAGMRILFGSRVFDISAPPVNVKERNVEMIIACTEQTIGG